MTDGLKDSHREAIIATIAANDRVERAVLFGSRATQTNTVSSDVDIALFGDRLTLTDRARLTAALDEIPMAQSVDLVLYNSIDHRTLQEHIRSHGVEWYARPRVPLSGGQARADNGPDVHVMSGRDETTSDWRRRDVGALIGGGLLFVGDGYRAKNSELADVGLPFARAGNIADGFRFSGADRFPQNRVPTIGNKLSRPGDVVFTSKGTVGRFAFVRTDTEPFVYSPQLCFWRSLDPDVLDPYFLYCWMRSREFFNQFRSVASQTDMAEYVSLKDQRRMSITFPPLLDQRAIAHILGTLDDKIELNRRMNATLEAMARALFKSWFVDFDPVRAKMEGRDTGLPNHIAELFPDRLVDSELGATPQGWEVSEIGREVEAVGGSTPSTKEPAYWIDGRRHWVTPKDLSTLSSLALLETKRKITDAGIKTISSGLLPVGTVLLSSRAPIGYLAIAEVPTAVNQGFIAMVCKKRLPNLYVLFWCYENLDHLKDISGGSTFAEISRKTFRTVPAIVPSKEVLTAYEDVVRPLYDRIVANIRESATLIQTRDLLLSKLVSGEIRIRDAEKAAGAVT